MKDALESCRDAEFQVRNPGGGAAWLATAGRLAALTAAGHGPPFSSLCLASTPSLNLPLSSTLIPAFKHSNLPPGQSPPSPSRPLCLQRPRCCQCLSDPLALALALPPADASLPAPSPGPLPPS